MGSFGRSAPGGLKPRLPAGPMGGVGGLWIFPAFPSHRHVMVRLVSRWPQLVPDALSRLWIVFLPPPPSAQPGPLFSRHRQAILCFVSRRPQPVPNDLSRLGIVFQPPLLSAPPCLLVHW